MTIRPVAERFAVAPQIAPSDLPRLRELGFRALICTRPDGEEPGQPPFAAIAAAARAAAAAGAGAPG
jgi:sulfide:quinone oxidoreductase